MIRHDAVDFLRHTTIEASQPSFDVSHGHRQLRGCQGAGQGGVRVAVYEQQVGTFGNQHVLDSFEHGAGLTSM